MEERKLKMQQAMDDRARRIAELNEECRRHLDQTTAQYNALLVGCATNAQNASIL